MKNPSPPELGPATYRATLKEAAPLYVILGFLCGCSVYAAFHSTGIENHLGFGIAAFVFALAILVFRFRLFVKVDLERLTSQGFVAQHSARWDEIKSVTALGLPGQPVGRGNYGPFVYRFVGEAESVTINFKFFSRQCYRVIFAEIARRAIPIVDSEGNSMEDFQESAFFSRRRDR